MAQPASPQSDQTRRASNRTRLTQWVLQKLTYRPANRIRAMLLVIMLVLMIGYGDYLAGVRVSLQFFYLLPIAICAAWAGWRAACLVSVLCLVSRITGDYLAGARFLHPGVQVWNRLVDLAVYCVVVWIFYALVKLHRELEQRVNERTQALTEEISERERLEREIMSITERERWSIGHDLHDGLCQHFTATAMAAQILARSLDRDGTPASADAHRVVALIEDGIGQTRRLARGLLLVSVEVDGLVNALRELAATSYEQFRVPCDLHVEGALLVNDGLMATHVFRIAQEATRNASRHGRANRVEIDVTATDTEVTMTITDDGVGIPPSRAGNRGMGLRIMAHRAKIIGAEFGIEPGPKGGTVVTCRWQPLPASA